MNLAKSARGRVARVLGLMVVPGAMALSFVAAGQAAASNTQAQLQETWREAISNTPTPGEGCFKAAYPSATWARADCVTAPDTPYIPRLGHGGFTVGNGNDYAAVVTGLISNGKGSFPTVTGVTRETGAGGAPNTYSIQLNSQFFTTAACNGSSNKANCLGWEQFVYSSSSQAGFMQYWLINYGTPCPSGGWMAFSGSCYRNSRAVSVPKEAITQLSHLTVTGKAVSGGIDTFTMTTATNAYSTTGNDTVVFLAKSWNASEFNIIGDGGGSGAKFNRGSKVTVKIALTDGSSSAPVCKSHDGTTGETNNLNLGSCTAAGGSTPSVTFTESN